jgi:MinD superfamily P-loop ATPase
MKELTILSGKGGTGKTTITAALAGIAKNAVICDNDVDAADLHLILHPEIKERHVFHGGWVAKIDRDKCSGCNLCMDYCRFDAIHLNGTGIPTINPYQCEGCRLCERVCPVNAIHSERSKNNFWFVSTSRFGKFVHATMGPGEENSGKLVTQIRKHSREIAKEIEADYIINDGPPGIGCAAISSVSGTGEVLMVIEPTISGIHDAKRLVELINNFNIPICAIINKYDLDLQNSTEIESFLKEKNIELLGKIPFDREMVESMVNGKTIIEYNPDSAISNMLTKLWENLK